jgi:hypothetical protein
MVNCHQTEEKRDFGTGKRVARDPRRVTGPGSMAPAAGKVGKHLGEVFPVPLEGSQQQVSFRAFKERKVAMG